MELARCFLSHPCSQTLEPSLYCREHHTSESGHLSKARLFDFEKPDFQVTEVSLCMLGKQPRHSLPSW